MPRRPIHPSRARRRSPATLDAVASGVNPHLLGEDFVLARAASIFRLDRYGASLKREGGGVVIRIRNRTDREVLAGVAAPMAEWLRGHGLAGAWRLTWRVG